MFGSFQSIQLAPAISLFGGHSRTLAQTTVIAFLGGHGAFLLVVPLPCETLIVVGIRDAGFGGLPAELVDAAADRRPVSLHWSVRSNGLLAVLPLAFLLVLSYAEHLGVWLVPAALVFVLIVGIRRIDVDATTLTVVPVLPILPKQRFPFARLGPFGRKNVARGVRPGLQSLLSGGQRFRAANVWPSRKLSLVAVYGPSTLSRALTGDQLIAFLESYRTAASATFG